jgi:hypothetical protein
VRGRVQGPRFSGWALTATASARHFLLTRRLLSRPDHPAFYLCWTPEETPATMTLTIAETARLVRLTGQYATGLITGARLALHLRWSRWRRRHQARARWHHYSARLAAAAAT